jgi:hypothetical protein
MSSSSAAAERERDESPLESLPTNAIAQGAAVTKVTTIQLATESIGVAAEATASPEVITAEITASPEVITAEVAASPEVITAEVAASPEVTTTPVVAHTSSSTAFAHEFITKQRKFSIVWVFLVFIDINNIIWIIPAILVFFIPAIFIFIDDLL